MKVKLKHKKYPPSYLARVVVWKTAHPFFVNPRGILVHRTRAVVTHLHDDGKVSHHSVDFWCGGLACFHDKKDLLADPPKDRLLCVWCEVRATAFRQKTSDQLAGRHVHQGKCVPMRTCCEHLN